jgi:hypothetical protein
MPDDALLQESEIRDFRDSNGLLKYLYIQLGEEDISLDKCRTGSRWKRVNCVKKDVQIVDEKTTEVEPKRNAEGTEMLGLHVC